MTRILVTGATGFVGAHLTNKLLNEGNEVVTIVHDLHKVNGNTLKLLNIYDKTDKAIGSLTDETFVKRVVSDYEVSIIYHLAALPIVRVGNISPVPIWATNLQGTWNIMEAAKESGASVFYLSTDKVYGHHGSIPYEEHFALNGLNIYDCSKACADNIVRSYTKVYGIKTAIVRSCNIYGPGDLNSRLIPNTIRRCLKNKSPIIYEGIKYVREWIYVDDAINAFLLVAKNLEKESGDVYNIGTGFSADQTEVIPRILSYFPGITSEIRKPLPYMKEEIPYQVLSTKKIRKKLGWESKVSFDDGLAKVINWWRKHNHII